MAGPGWVPHSMELLVKDGEHRRIPVVLEAAPQTSTTWIWVGGGAVAAAALTVGGVFLFRPREKTVVPGTYPAGGTVQLSFGYKGIRLEAAR